jgi:hypothetical protein
MCDQAIEGRECKQAAGLPDIESHFTMPASVDWLTLPESALYSFLAG